MPIYEYQCSDCGHEAEVFQRMSDPDETQCPQCKSEKFQRLISAAGFRLKGAGWYETDFKSDNKRNLAGGDAAAAGKAVPATGGDTKPDASPAAKDAASSSDSKPASSGDSGSKAAA